MNVDAQWREMVIVSWPILLYLSIWRVVLRYTQWRRRCCLWMVFSRRWCFGHDFGFPYSPHLGMVPLQWKRPNLSSPNTRTTNIKLIQPQCVKEYFGDTRCHWMMCLWMASTCKAFNELMMQPWSQNCKLRRNLQASLSASHSCCCVSARLAWRPINHGLASWSGLKSPSFSARLQCHFETSTQLCSSIQFPAA